MRSQKFTFGRGMVLIQQCARLCVGQAAAADKASVFCINIIMMPPAWQSVRPPLSRSASQR